MYKRDSQSHQNSCVHKVVNVHISFVGHCYDNQEDDDADDDAMKYPHK